MFGNSSRRTVSTSVTIIFWSLSEEVSYLAVHQQGRQDAEGENGPDHGPEARPAHLDGLGQRAAVELYEQDRVDEHHHPAYRRLGKEQHERLAGEGQQDRNVEGDQEPHGGEVEFGLRPERALRQVAALQDVAHAPAHVVEDAKSPGEQRERTYEVEEHLEPAAHDLAKDQALVAEKVDVLAKVLPVHGGVGNHGHK